MFAEAAWLGSSRTALRLATAASDRAGSLDSNSIIINPFNSSTFFFFFSPQIMWNSGAKHHPSVEIP